MTNELLVSFPVPRKVVSMVKHSLLLSMTRLVLDLSSPAPKPVSFMSRLMRGDLLKAAFQWGPNGH